MANDGIMGLHITVIVYNPVSYGGKLSYSLNMEA